MSLGVWKPCVAILLLLVSGTQDLIAAQSGTRGQRSQSLSTRELAAQVRRSLVVVLTQDHEGNLIAQGSGFFFRPGFVATNLHVLKRASQGYVKSLSEGVSYKISSVVGFDLKHDICVLKLSEAGGTPLPLSTDDVAVGDDILVAGNPEGLEASFSKGIVSGMRSASALIQIDAAISPGSSGGPVVNQRGEVIGLAVSSLVEGQNLNFAVPVRYLREQKLVWDLRVGTVGGLAVTDLEEDGFHGPVRTVTETYAGYTFNEAKNTYVEGPAETLEASRYNRDGRLEEHTNFINGVEDLKDIWEYSDDGLRRRNTLIIGQEHPEPGDILPPVIAVNTMAMNAPFDRAEGVGTKGDRHYHEDKYDSGGHLIEKTFPQRGIKDVMKYDSLGREVEILEYRQGKLESATHSTYEDNERGDWVQQHETLWVANEKDGGFTPLAEHYRQITYYGESGR
jgi:serine protease Do